MSFKMSWTSKELNGPQDPDRVRNEDAVGCGGDTCGIGDYDPQSGEWSAPLHRHMVEIEEGAGERIFAILDVGP